MSDIDEESLEDEENPFPQDHEVEMVDDGSVSDHHSGIEQEEVKEVRPSVTLDVNVSILQSFASVQHTQQNRISRDPKNC